MTYKKTALLGNNCITKAIGKVMELFGVKVSKDGRSDILVMVDGDSFKRDDLRGALRGTECMIYFESKYNNVHPLCFLSDIFPTYKISLDNFSIADLGRVINEIYNNKRGDTLAHAVTVEDIFNGTVFDKLSAKPYRLKQLADTIVNAYLHKIQNGTWTTVNKKTAKETNETFDIIRYDEFKNLFDSVNQWRKGEEKLEECLRDLKDMGFGLTNYHVLKELKNEFKSLRKMAFPADFPEDINQQATIREMIGRCFEICQHIEQLGKTYYDTTN